MLSTICKLPLHSKWSAYVLTGFVALLGGALFSLLHIPIPWLLGPMFAALIGSKGIKLPLKWPSTIRDAGILIVGYAMGLSLTKDALIEIAHQLPTMLLMAILLITLCLVGAFILARLSGFNLITMITSSIPGGLTQVLTLAEEFKGIDVTVVSFFQVTRVMMLVFFIPMLLFSPLFAAEHSGAGIASGAAGAGAASATASDWAALYPSILLFAPACLAFAWLGKKLRLPTAYMLGPMLGFAVLNVCGLHGPALPSLILNISQVLIGTYVGLLMNPGKLERKGRTITLALAGGGILVLSSLAMSGLLRALHPINRPTALLSMAPGGMDQMGIMAHEIGADLSVVSGYQTFRLLFINFVVATSLKLILTYAAKRTRAYEK